MPTHSEAFEAVVYAMTKSEAKVIDSLDEVGAIVTALFTVLKSLTNPRLLPMQ